MKNAYHKNQSMLRAYKEPTNSRSKEHHSLSQCNGRKCQKHDGEKNMKSLRESAIEYEPPKTLNIADLEKVSLDSPLDKKTFKEGTSEEFTVDLILVEGKEYRVPGSVLTTLKEIIEFQPKITHVKVIKKGEGMKTQYTVIPLGSDEELVE